MFISFIYSSAYVNPNFLIYPSPTLFPFGNRKLDFYGSLFLFCKQVHLYHFLDSTYKWHMIDINVTLFEPLVGEV